MESLSVGSYADSLLEPDTSVSRSLGASFSELIGQPTPPYLHVPGPSMTAPITATIEMLERIKMPKRGGELG